jgi:hypothetical protein
MAVVWPVAYRDAEGLRLHGGGWKKSADRDQGRDQKFFRNHISDSHACLPAHGLISQISK